MGMRDIVDVAKEASTTTGAGALTLGGAVAGYFALADLFAEGAIFDYHVENVTNASGVPEWEEGSGSLSSGTLVRTTVVRNSKLPSDTTKVAFTAGTKHVRVYATLQDYIDNAVAKAAP